MRLHPRCNQTLFAISYVDKETTNRLFGSFITEKLFSIKRQEAANHQPWR